MAFLNAKAIVAAMLVIPAAVPVTGPDAAVTIRTTSHGIPHVLAADHRGLGLGLGYAQAQQNLCEIAKDTVALSSGTDLYHTWFNQSGTLERLLAAEDGPSPGARELMRGYADGYNRYLAELSHPACQGTGRVRPITEIDLWRRAHRLAVNNSAAALTRQIATAVPPGQAPPGAGERAVVPPPASNAVAIGRDASAGGTGLLLANPHLPWKGPLRLFQQQLTIPGELDVSGVAFLGLPVVVMGHTDRLAWSHTASTARTFTLSRLTLAEDDPTSYLVDGKRHRMRQTVVTYGDPPVRRNVYETPEGPVVADPDLLPWTTENAYVLRDANAGNLRIIDQYLAIGRAHTVGELHSALSEHLGVPWANTVAADATGTAYFSGLQVVPAVTDALIERCGFDTDGVIILDGSRSSCAWSGILGPERLPVRTTAGVVSNMNDSPWLTTPEAPLTGFPSILGDIGTPRSARTRLGLDMFADREFALGTLQKTMFGNRNLLAEQGKKAIVRMCRGLAGGPVDVRAACRTLAAWNGRADLDSRGAYLWQEFLQLATERQIKIDAVPFDLADPVHTPRGLAAERMREAFIDTVRAFDAAGVPVDVPLGAVQRYAGVPIHGCEVSCFNVILNEEPPGPVASQPDVAFGTTFVMAAELSAAGPRVRTILVYGQSADVSSPLHTDQARLYAQKRWVTGRFTAAEILADPHLTVRTL